MAIDLTDKALDLASEAVRLADELLDAAEELDKLLTVATDSGINMTNFDTELAASSVKHVDGSTFNKLSTAIPTITAALDAADGAGVGLTARELFNQLRRNL